MRTADLAFLPIRSRACGDGVMLLNTFGGFGFQVYRRFKAIATGLQLSLYCAVMLSLSNNGPDPRRTGLSRRNFLSAGSLALGGLTLPDLLAAQAAASATGKSLVKDKAVIFLFMQGGPAQQELFDPKMDRPEGIRSATGEVKTSIPGVTFGSTLQRLSKLAHKLSVVRSFTTGDGNHDIKPIVGRDSLGANIGSLYARIAGTNRPDSAMPTNVALYPQAVDPTTMPPILNFGDINSSGDLGMAYSPFVPGSGGGLEDDLKLSISQRRLDDRRQLLGGLDRIKRAVDSSGAIEGVDKFQEQAFSTILSGVSDAFDLSKEDPRLVARYDTAPLISPEKISKRWANRERYIDNVKSLGKLLLMARRLCERGAGFVTVTTNFVWDKNNATMTEGMGYVGVPFDHAVSAFIEDLEARGLSEKIMLVCCGEMGRTPKINARGGRDHWGGLAPLMIYGGGLKMGQVIGQSSRDASEPSSHPYTIKNLIGTIMHTLLDTGEVRVTDGLPRQLVSAVTGYEPISELI
jgi:hypothetical protein